MHHVSRNGGGAIPRTAKEWVGLAQSKPTAAAIIGAFLLLVIFFSSGSYLRGQSSDWRRSSGRGHWSNSRKGAGIESFSSPQFDAAEYWRTVEQAGSTAQRDPPFWLWGDGEVRDFKNEEEMHAAYEKHKVPLLTINEYFENKGTGVTHEGLIWSAVKDSSPKLLYAHGTLEHEGCDQMVARAEKRLERSEINGGARGTSVVSVDRTSHGVFFTLPEDTVFEPNAKMRRRLASAIGVPESYAESTQILQYFEGELYKPHSDTFRAENKVTLERGGQRFATALTWLNDCPYGGETEFPYATPVSVGLPPRKGDTVIFYSLTDWYTVDHAAVHSANPPRNNSSKYVAVLWFHPRPFH